MTTADPDELGNPAGSPLRLRFQSSPAKRSAVENLEDGAWVVGCSFNSELRDEELRAFWSEQRLSQVANSLF